MSWYFESQYRWTPSSQQSDLLDLPFLQVRRCEIFAYDIVFLSQKVVAYRYTLLNCPSPALRDCTCRKTQCIAKLFSVYLGNFVVIVVQLRRVLSWTRDPATVENQGSSALASHAYYQGYPYQQNRPCNSALTTRCIGISCPYAALENEASLTTFKNDHGFKALKRFYHSQQPTGHFHPRICFSA